MAKHLVFDVEKLHDVCEEVNPIDAQQTVKELTAKLNKYKDLYALSAPQIGIKERVICIKFNDGVIKEYINPIELQSEELHFVRERDISIPEKEFICPRPNKVYVRYQLSSAKPEENILKGVVAEVFDRMMQYLLGITPQDIGSEIPDNFDEMSKKEQQEIISMCIESLKRRAQISNDDIEKDKDAKRLMEKIRFDEAVCKGEVQFDTSAIKEKK